MSISTARAILRDFDTAVFDIRAKIGNVQTWSRRLVVIIKVVELIVLIILSHRSLDLTPTILISGLLKFNYR